MPVALIRPEAVIVPVTVFPPHLSPPLHRSAGSTMNVKSLDSADTMHGVPVHSCLAERSCVAAVVTSASTNTKSCWSFIV